MKEKSKYKYAIHVTDSKIKLCGPKIDEAMETICDRLSFEPGMNGLVKLLWEPPLANAWHEYGDMYAAVASLLVMLIVKGVLKGKWLQRTTRATISAYSRLQRHGHEEYVRELD